jgi:hypothetical protein
MTRRLIVHVAPGPPTELRLVTTGPAGPEGPPLDFELLDEVQQAQQDDFLLLRTPGGLKKIRIGNLPFGSAPPPPAGTWANSDGLFANSDDLYANAG